MAGRDLTSCGTRAVLNVSVLALLSCAVVDVLLAAVESVWWPLVAAVAWWGAAIGVVIRAAAAATPRSRTPRAAPAWVTEELPVRRV
jgi:hypothetical protein